MTKREVKADREKFIAMLRRLLEDKKREVQQSSSSLGGVEHIVGKAAQLVRSGSATRQAEEDLAVTTRRDPTSFVVPEVLFL